MIYSMVDFRENVVNKLDFVKLRLRSIPGPFQVHTFHSRGTFNPKPNTISCFAHNSRHSNHKA